MNNYHLPKKPEKGKNGGSLLAGRGVKKNFAKAPMLNTKSRERSRDHCPHEWGGKKGRKFVGFLRA